MSRYITQTEGGRRWGCARQTVAHAMKPDGALFAAVVVHQGNRLVDWDHPAARAWRASSRKDPNLDPGDPRVLPDAPLAPSFAPSAAELPAEIRQCWQWTLERIVTECGTMPAFEKLLIAADRLESIHAKRLSADKSTGALIDRDYVQRHVLGLVERIFQRLLTDMPIKLSYEVHGLCKTGEPVEALQVAISAAITRELRTVKKDTRKAIRDAQG